MKLIVRFAVMLCAVVAVLLLLTSASASRAQSSTVRLQPATPLAEPPKSIGPAAARALARGPLPADQDELKRAKRRAEQSVARGGATDRGGAPSPNGVAAPDPTLLRGAEGLKQKNITPSDSTGAIGTTRYIETINESVGVFDRANLKRKKSASLATWWGTGAATVFDPQVIWDPTTQRFYYTGDAIFDDTDNRLAFGFSKSGSPSNFTSDWCKYTFNYGAEFPDYPKLGDSKDFAIIGVNVFNSNSSFVRADVLAIPKPAAGAIVNCPGLNATVGEDLRVGAAQSFTPVPANEIDTDDIGYVVARTSELPSTSLHLFKVLNVGGSPDIETEGTLVPVASYDAAANAPQAGTDLLIDSGDGRPTQGVAAVDPRFAKLALWTQHTVFGGDGAEVRWYEIDPVAGVVLQFGTQTSGSEYIFNGAISPDRVVNGATTAFGSNMLLNFNTSSASTFPAIRMVSKQGADSVSDSVVVKQSPGPDIDFACFGQSICRWGDYAAATPDPAASTSNVTGVVFSSSMWTVDGRKTGSNGTSWRTWNWSARP